MIKLFFIYIFQILNCLPSKELRVVCMVPLLFLNIRINECPRESKLSSEHQAFAKLTFQAKKCKRRVMPTAKGTKLNHHSLKATVAYSMNIHAPLIFTICKHNLLHINIYRTRVVR